MNGARVMRRYDRRLVVALPVVMPFGELTTNDACACDPKPMRSHATGSLTMGR